MESLGSMVTIFPWVSTRSAVGIADSANRLPDKIPAAVTPVILRKSLLLICLLDGSAIAGTWEERLTIPSSPESGLR
jgi:hypothetical protein